MRPSILPTTVEGFKQRLANLERSVADLQRRGGAGGGREQVGGAEVVSGAGGTPTYLVAASNASSISKAKADFVCDGTADDVEINAAFAAAQADYAYGARVQLSEGDFYLADSIDMAYGRSLVGLARGTWLYVSTASPAIDGLDSGHVADLVIRGNSTTPPAIGINVTGDDAEVRNCEVGYFTANVKVASGSARCRVLDNYLGGFKSGTFDVDDLGNLTIIRGNVMSNGARFAGFDAMLVGNVVQVNAVVNFTVSAIGGVFDANHFPYSSPSITNNGTAINIGANFSASGPW